MSDAGETFFTSVGCMDGRVQDPVAEFGREKFGAKFADTITEAGLVGQLASDNPDDKLLKSLKSKIDISLEKHHSKGIIVHGHEDCAGNPVEDQTHKENVRAAADLVRSFAPGIEIIPVFVVEEDGEWIVQPL